MRRQIVGDRTVYIRNGYYEHLIVVGDEVIACIQSVLDYENPPTGHDIAHLIKAKEEDLVVSESNPLFCETENELKHAIYILDTLSDRECEKIEYCWDKYILGR